MVPVQFFTLPLTPAEVETQVQQALTAGCRWITLRFTDDTTDADAEPAARRIVTACHKQGVIVLTEGRAELCRTIEADGVHMSDGSMTSVQVREMLGGEHGHAAIVGCNASGDTEALVAFGKQGADYAIVTAEANDFPILCDALHKAGIRLPLCVEENDVANVGSLLEAGVQGIVTSNVSLIESLLAADDGK